MLKAKNSEGRTLIERRPGYITLYHSSDRRAKTTSVNVDITEAEIHRP